jgi:hypothetical protein
MSPIDARARKRVKQLTAVGHGNEPRCFTLSTADGGTSVMLLGKAASEPLAPAVSADQVDALCRQAAPLK